MHVARHCERGRVKQSQALCEIASFLAITNMK